MNFTLIVCTYMRPQPLIKLLDSVNKQTLYPNQILIVDGSLNTTTQEFLEENLYKNLEYSPISGTTVGKRTTIIMAI